MKKLEGRVDLNFDCVSGEIPEYLRKEIAVAAANLMRVVYYRLGHRVRVYPVDRDPTKALSDNDHEDEVQDIKNLANIAFMAFRECDYNIADAVVLLELREVIPKRDLP